MICDAMIKNVLPEGADPRQPDMLSPLVLAYVGDTVYDLYVRTRLVQRSDAGAHGLHMMSAGIVNAKAQAEAYRRIADMLTEREAEIFRRGRNSHMGTVPRNAAITDYRAATGLEALAGWLYLRGDDERLRELIDAALPQE